MNCLLVAEVCVGIASWQSVTLTKANTESKRSRVMGSVGCLSDRLGTLQIKGSSSTVAETHRSSRYVEHFHSLVDTFQVLLLHAIRGTTARLQRVIRID